MIFVITSCNSPRNNPFDPKSDLYLPPQPPARVMDFHIDSLTDGMANLSWTSPEGAYQYSLYYGSSDWTGSTIDGAEKYRGILPGVLPVGSAQSAWIELPTPGVFSWSMFCLSESGLLSSGSDTITIETGKLDNPAEISASVRTIRISGWDDPFDDWIGLDARAVVIDLDGIDSVSLHTEFQWLGNLTLRNGGLEWGREFADYDLPDASVEALVGHPLTIMSYDLEGFVTKSNPMHLIRIIDLVPTTNAPAQDSLDTELPLVAQFPLLEWDPYFAEFSFTYSIQIVHVAESYVHTNLALISEIHSDSTSYRVDEELTTEERYLLWTVAVVDEFGNEARSKEAGFRIDKNE